MVENHFFATMFGSVCRASLNWNQGDALIENFFINPKSFKLNHRIYATVRSH